MIPTRLYRSPQYVGGMEREGRDVTAIVHDEFIRHARQHSGGGVDMTENTKKKVIENRKRDKLRKEKPQVFEKIVKLADMEKQRLCRLRASTSASITPATSNAATAWP